MLGFGLDMRSSLFELLYYDSRSFGSFGGFGHQG